MKKMHQIIITICLIMFFVPSLAQNKTPNCQHVTTSKIAGLFDRWNDTLKTKNPQVVAQYYNKDAVLLPTLSNEPRTTRKEIVEYFEKFLKKSPEGKINHRVIRIGCDWASDTGIYTFQLSENGKEQKVQARYSFVYEYVNGQWMIVHHHSSLMPDVLDEDGY